tara:strand:+ start:88 stop:333 length:246 start_codon:yes stop_codon:yes gene_type:complete
VRGVVMSLKRSIKNTKKQLANIKQEIKELQLKQDRARKLENRFKLQDKIQAKYTAIESLEIKLDILKWMYNHPQNKKKESS